MDWKGKNKPQTDSLNDAVHVNDDNDYGRYHIVSKTSVDL